MAVYRRGTAVSEITRRGRPVTEIYRENSLVYQKIISGISLTPRFVRLNPDGEEYHVVVDSVIPWKIASTEYEWQDGTGDKLTVEYTGNKGIGRITLKTSVNTTGQREIEIPVLTERGKTVAKLKVSQSNIWSRESYANGYSDGYPAFMAVPSLEVVPENLFLEDSPPGSSQMQITTTPTINWNIQINY